MEKMVEVIVRNCGWEVVMRLLKSKGAGVEITDRVSEAAAARARGEGLMMIAVASRMNGQERARCIEREFTEAMLEVIRG